jgi:hypothetical protein
MWLSSFLTTLLAPESFALYRLLLVNFAMRIVDLQDSVVEQGSGCILLPQQHHRRLLEELGVARLESSSLWKSRSTPLADIAAAALALSQYMNVAATAGGIGSGSSSGSRANVLTPSSSSSKAEAEGTVSGAGSSSSSGCRWSFSAVEEAAMLALLQAALLLAAGFGAQWLYGMSTILQGFLESLIDPALEAAAAIMMQPFLTQLLPASLTAAKAAAKAATSASDTATLQLPLSTGQAAAAASPASTSAAQPPADPDECLVYVTEALLMLVGTGGHPRRLCLICCSF